MNEKMKHISGFAALNSGTILNCYSAVRIKTKGPASGFCTENTGSLRNCMFCGSIRNGKNSRSGLCQKQKGSLENCFFIRGKNEDDKESYTDWNLSLLKSDLAKDPLPAVVSPWDTTSIWACRDGVFSLYDNPKGFDNYERVVEISTKQDLDQMASSINSGNALPGTLYRLTKDINLGGREWTPIGADPYMPFDSAFDGAGHTIQNFRINTQKHPYAGLFGCTSRNAIIANLTVDCILTQKGNCAGPICAQNHGLIHNCIVRAQTSICRYTGGFTGQNMGVISNCCALGRVYNPLILPWWLPMLSLILLTGVLSSVFYFNAQNTTPQEIFAPVIIDPNASPIEDETFKPDESEITDTTATFIMNAEMSISSANYAGAIGLRCPTWSTRGFVATVRVTDSDLRANGISTNAEYHTVYQSGLIQPGYGVDVITLSALQDGTKLPAGRYELSVLFEFYDIHTNEKSAVDSVVPLDVTIR